jgi:hypothetical protein
MRQHDFEGAQQEVARIESQVAGMEVAASANALKARAENWANWADFVLQQYGWALNPNLGYSMNRMIQDLRALLIAGNAGKIEEKLTELQATVGSLPEVVRLFLGMRNSIAGDVRPADPARAAELLRRLEDAENMVRSKSPGAGNELNALAEEVSRAIQDVGRAKARVCSKGHRLAPGERFCSECREDTWALDAGLPNR